MKISPTTFVYKALRLATAALFLALVACSSPEEKAEAHLARGQEFLSAKDYTSASLEFRNAIKFNEKLTGAWLGLAEVLEHQKNWRGVANSLSKALELDTNLVEPRIKLGRLYMLGNNESVEKALEHINKANELEANNPDVMALRAALLFRLDDRNGARRDAERALELSPDNQDAYGVLAADKLKDGDKEGALAFIDRGLALRANSASLLQLKARIFEQAKDDTNLELVMRKLISFYPDERIHRLRLIRFLTTRKRPGEAEVELRTLASANPDDTSLNLQLVQFVRSTKGSEQAQSELNSLIAEKPQIADYKLAMAELKFAQDGIDAAKPVIADLITSGEPKADSLRARVLLARMYLQSKKLDEATKLVDETLSKDEKNSDALALRATLRLDANDTVNAISDLREALSQKPRSVGLLHLLGRAFEKQGSPELAEDNYARAVQLSNYDSKMTMSYLGFLSRQKKAERAEQVLNDAVARNPSPQLLTTLAQMRLRKQDWVGAVEVANMMKKLGVANKVSNEILGVAQIGQKDFDAGISTFKKIYSQSEGAARPMLALASAYVQSGNLEQAEQFLQTVLTANDSNAMAHVLLGSLRMMQKKPAEAETAYKLAIERQPKNPAGHFALSRFYLAKNDLKAAVDALKTAHVTLPNNARLGLLLAGLFERNKDIEAAIDVYEQLLKSNPRMPILLNNLASLLADYRTDEASLERARTLSSGLKGNNIPHFKDTIGWVEYRSGNYRLALTNLKDAAERLPKLGLVRYHLGMTYAALEQPVDAKRELGEALILAANDKDLSNKITEAISQLPKN